MFVQITCFVASVVYVDYKLPATQTVLRMFSSNSIVLTYVPPLLVLIVIVLTAPTIYLLVKRIWFYKSAYFSTLLSFLVIGLILWAFQPILAKLNPINPEINSKFWEV